MAYTYTPKVGDVVRFPNGVEVNYSEHDQTLVVLPPKDKTLVTYQLSDSKATLLIGVSQ